MDRGDGDVGSAGIIDVHSPLAMAWWDKVKGWLTRGADVSEVARDEASEPGVRSEDVGDPVPSDTEIEREARALFAAGDPAGAIALLRNAAVLFAAHQDSDLPCLCAGCLEPELAGAEHDGIRYVREFTIASHRVLFFWMPEELAANAKQVRKSLRAELRCQLDRRARQVDKPRTGINPFTKERIEIPPRRPRPVTNPFIGEKVG